MLAASLAVSGEVRLQNVPQVRDVQTMVQLLQSMGTSTSRGDNNSWILRTTDQLNPVAGYGLVSRMRAGVCVLGPLLARWRRATVALPGGCRIGHRPIDLHLRGLTALGADIRIQSGYVHARANARLTGAEINLLGPAGPTVTGTCNLLTAAVLAKGKTILHGAAREPEVQNLAAFLSAAGAQIEGAGTPTIEIQGVEQLRAVTHRIPADRIEAATLAIAALITGGEISIRDAPAAEMQAVINLLGESGAVIHATDRTLNVRSAGRLNAASILTEPYPGIPTDLQAQLMALMTVARGTSRVTETIFPERFHHVAELSRLGAVIYRTGNTAVVDGVPALSGAPLLATDLRAGAALVLAGLAAVGKTEIGGIGHLDRGYDQLEQKICSLGGRIRREVEITDGGDPGDGGLKLSESL